MRIGTMELLVILLVAFLVLGPEKTAQYTKKAGKAIRTLKFYMNSFTDDLKEPLQEITQPLEEIKKPLEELKQPLEELKKPLAELKNPLAGPMAAGSAPPPDSASAEMTGGEPLTVQAETAETDTAEELEDAIPLEEA